MNFFELMTGSITADQTAATIRTGTRQNGSGKSSGYSFSKILDSRMANTSISVENLKGSTAASTAGQRTSKGPAEQSEPLYKSYRQASDSIRNSGANEKRTVGKASSQNKAEWKDDGTYEMSEEAKNDTSADVIQMLAQLLGVDQEILKKLLAEYGISSEMLNVLENTGEAVLILSDALGLTPDEQDTLRKLLEMIKGTVADVAQSDDITEILPSDPGRQLTQDTVESSGAEGSRPEAAKTDFDPAVEQLMIKISEKLDEFAEKLVSEQDAAEDEIGKLLEPMLKKSEAAKQNVAQEGQAANSDTMEGIKIADENSVKETKPQKEDADEKNDLQMRNGSGKHELMPKPAQQGDENVQQMFVNSVSDSSVTADVSHIAPQRQTVPAREIISQIVEKAGAVITQDKAEMVMELKPESLGRISLKVVTENGIITARFVAENRQVQQVLETNMQMLKDSLERQGINVQSLSVSVRQDERQQTDSRQQYGNTQRIGNRRSVTGIKAVEGGTAGYVEAKPVMNPYMWDGSTINLTA